MSGAAKGPGDEGGYRLLVRSIGTADVSVIPALRRLRSAPDRELAALLYRAPSELLTGLDLETGSQLRDVLRKTGVDVEVEPASVPFQPGTDEFEVALVVKKHDRMVPLLEETMRLLGVDLDTGRRIVCDMPAVLLGGVSEATVEAIRARFAPLGVEVDASRGREALYDMALEAGDEDTRSRLTRVLGEEGVKVPWTERGQLLATGFTRAQAEAVWEQAARTAGKARVLNRDLQRFDVRLERAPDTPEMKGWLMEVTGMPAATAEVAVGRTPFLLAENESAARTMALCASAAELGARASGILLALQRFSLAVDSGGDRASIRPWVETLAGAKAAERFLRPGPLTLEGPFTKTQARWLQTELRRGGVPARLVER